MTTRAKFILTVLMVASLAYFVRLNAESASGGAPSITHSELPQAGIRPLS